MYSEKLLDYFYNPRNVGVIKGANGMGKVGNPASGDMIRLYIKVENDIVVDAKFQTYGNPASIACSSIVTEMILNKNFEQMLKISSEDIITEINGLPEDKKYCADLARESIVEAIEDYKRKQKGEKKPRKKQVRS